MRRTSRTVRFACGVATALALSLAGCTPGEPAKPTGADAETVETRLAPHGDPAMWFRDAYAQGVGGVYATPNLVCGLTEDLSVELQRGPGLESTVLARELVGGAVRWQIENARCDAGALTPDGELVIGVVAGVGVETDWSLTSAATGETVEPLPAPARAHRLGHLTTAGDVEVYAVDGAELIGVTAGAVAWSAPLPQSAQITPLADGKIGVLASGMSVIDGRTGETTFEQAVSHPHDLTWASDGYVLKVNESDPEYAFYDLEGDEVDRTDGTSQYPFVPSPRDGITFAVADHVAAGPVVGVDSEGHPALFEGEQRRNFTPRGEIEELPNSIISLEGVSTGGSLFLFDDEASGDRIVVIDAEGEPVFEWPAPSGGDARVESGYIVVETGGSTQVLLPAT